MNKEINWLTASFYLFALSFIMFNIITYFYDKAFGVVCVFVVFNFSMFFFLRRNYRFFINTIVYFYIVGILGSFLMSIFNPIYLTFFLAIIFYLTFSLSALPSSNDIEKSELKKLLLFDASLFVFFLMIAYYSYKYIDKI